MANNYEQVLALLKDANGNDKNIMGLSNTIMRDNGIPLDYSSIQEDLDSALAYAKSGIAYIGQPISVGDTLYIVTDEANGYLKAIGTQASDDSSISVDNSGKLTLKGFAAAADATIPRKKADGTLEWITFDALVDGDGNTKAIVKATDDSDITVTSVYDEQTDTYTYTLDVQFPAIPEYSIVKTTGTNQTIYNLAKDGIVVDEGIVVPNAYDDSYLASRIAAVEGSISEHTDTLAGIELFFKDATKDEGDGENLKNAFDTLVEIQNYITRDGAAADSMLSAIDANTSAIELLNGEGAGSIKQAIIDATSQYAEKSDLAAVRTIAESAATQADIANITSILDTKVSNSTLIGEYYNKTAVDTLLAGITGANGETASSVAAALEVHKSENAAKFAEIQTKDDSQDSLIQANKDAIDIINDATTGILAQAKAEVTRLESGLVTTNTNDISAIKDQINGINSNISSFSASISDNRAAANAAQETANSAISKVTEVETDIADLTTAIANETTARETLSDQVANNIAAIEVLQNSANEFASDISEHANKFNNYYTSTEVDNKITEAIEGVDSTAITAAIEANTNAIEAEVTRADTEEKRLAGLISDNTANILSLENTLKTIADGDDETLNSIKDLADWVKEHESEVLPTINANSRAIETITGTGEGSIKKAIEDIPHATALKAGLVKTSDEVTVTADGAMSIGYISTDKLVQGNDTLVLRGGTASVGTEKIETE